MVGRNHTSIFTPFAGMFEIYFPVNRLMGLKQVCMGSSGCVTVGQLVCQLGGGGYGMASNYKTSPEHWQRS